MAPCAAKISPAGKPREAVDIVFQALNLQRTLLQPDKRLTFLQGFLRNPSLVGSIIPSSRFLERRLVDLARVARARLVVEYGPGTGGTTRAVLRSLPQRSRLLAIEIDPQFAALLRADLDPRLLVHQGSADEVQAALAAHGLGRPDVILSGIPFSTMPESLGQRILQATWSSLPPGGQFIAYQFRDRVARLGTPLLGPPETLFEVRNVPPVRLYRWRKPGGNGSETVA